MGAVLFLFSPQPKSKEVNFFALNSYVWVPVGVDTYSYIRPAQFFFEEMFLPRQSRVTRPLYILAGKSLGGLVDIGFSITGIKNLGLYKKISEKAGKNTADTWIVYGKNNSLSPEERERQYKNIQERAEGAIPYFVAYILLNLITLWAGLLLFDKILTSWGVNQKIIYLTAPLLIFNDIVKPQIWAVHQQMLSIFSPLLLIYIIDKILKGNSGAKYMYWTSFLVGLLVCTYGNFLPFLPALLIAMYISHQSKKIPLSSTIRQSFWVSVLFAAPISIWLGIVLYVVGSFYSVETTSCRQFVWVLDALALGPSGFIRTLYDYSIEYLSTFDVQILLWLGCAIAAYGYLKQHPVKTQELKRKGAPALYVFFLYFVFYAAMGYYRVRLTFTLVAPLLVFLALQLDTIYKSLPDKRKSYLTGGVGCISFVWAAWHVLKYGPFK